jgi:hypothetical protein
MTFKYRPQKRINDSDFQQFTVPTGQTVHAGMPIKLNATDAGSGDANRPEAQECTADTDNVIAIAYSGDDPAKSWTAGQIFDAVLLGDGATIPVLIGTGGVTRGSSVVATTDGLKNAPAHGTASRIYSPGVALETASAGEWAPILVQKVALSKA